MRFDPEAWLMGRLGPLLPLPFTLEEAPVDVRLIRRGDCTLCTTVGLSNMNLGVDYLAEVLMRLPPSYPNTTLLGADARWPVDWLLSCARDALLRPMLIPLHTFGNGSPPLPLGPGTPFVGSIVLPVDIDEPVPTGDAGNSLRLLELMPLHPEELSLGRQDPLKLMEAFERAALPNEPIVSNDRRSVIESGS